MSRTDGVTNGNSSPSADQANRDIIDIVVKEEVKSPSATPSPPVEHSSKSRSRSSSRSQSRRRDRDVSRDRDSSPRKKRRHRTKSRSKSRERDRSREREGRRRSRRSRTRSRSKSRTPPKISNEMIKNAYKEVRHNPENFDGWMLVLNLVEAENDMHIAREVFDKFLKRYPFCYGFWTKYAAMERKNQNFTEALGVWERGILAIPLSTDLWLGFLSFMREVAPQSEGGVTKLRELFDRALTIAGLEYNSDKLWLEAIGWEEQQGNWQRVLQIYDRLLKVPTAHFKTHYDRLEIIVGNYEPDILLSTEEYDEIFHLTRKHVTIGIDQICTEEEILEDGPPDTINESGEVHPKLVKKKKHHPEALAFFRAEIMARRRRVHQDTAAMVSNRILFEEAIKRPYFHVKPLEVPEIKNWKSYLHFEMNEGNEERTGVLFERCLIACALYEDFWLMYARWTRDKRRSETLTREIYNRALVHCPKSVNIYLAFSAFEEALGDYSTANSILDKFEQKYQGYAAIQLRKIGIMRRKAEESSKPDYTAVSAAWEQLIHGESTRHLSSYYSIKLARFHLKCRNDRRLAEKVLKRAIDRDRENMQLHLQLIDLAYTNPEFSQTAVLEAFDYALNSRLSDEEKIRLSQRKLDFLEDVSYDIDIIQEHQEKHSQLVKESDRAAMSTRKRRYERDSRGVLRPTSSSDNGRWPSSRGTTQGSYSNPPPVYNTWQQPVAYGYPPQQPMGLTSGYYIDPTQQQHHQ